MKKIFISRIVTVILIFFIAMLYIPISVAEQKIQFTEYQTPTIICGETGEISFEIANLYNNNLGNINITMEIYRYATTQDTKMISEIKHVPVFTVTNTTIFTYFIDELENNGSKIIKTKIKTSQQTPAGTYFIRTKVRFDMSNRTMVMYSIGYFSSEEIYDYKTNSTLPANCSGIVPETSFCVVAYIYNWLIYIIMVIGIVIAIISFVYYLHEKKT